MRGTAGWTQPSRFHQGGGGGGGWGRGLGLCGFETMYGESTDYQQVQEYVEL